MTAKITSEDEKSSFDERQAVEAALRTYMDGAKAGNGKQAVTAFHKDTKVIGSVMGKYEVVGKEAFIGAVESMGPQPGIQSRIASIDISGPAASARVEFLNWAGFRFTDFFVLYKVSGEWKITGKVYDSHSKN